MGCSCIPRWKPRYLPTLLANLPTRALCSRQWGLGVGEGCSFCSPTRPWDPLQARPLGHTRTSRDVFLLTSFGYVLPWVHVVSGYAFGCKASFRSGELETDLRSGELGSLNRRRRGSPVCSSNIRRARMALGHKQKQLLRGSKRVHFLLPTYASLYGCTETTPTDPLSTPPPVLYPWRPSSFASQWSVLTHRCFPVQN